MEQELRFYRGYFEVRGTPTKIIGKIPYNSPSEPMTGGYGGSFVEILKPGVFKDSLKSGRDIKAYWSHDNSKVIGSTKAGTLFLTDTATGLKIELDPGQKSWGRDALEAVRRGDVSGFSFAFTPVEEEYSDDYDYRYILKANLYEVSPVGQVAYSSSTAYARSKSNNQTEVFKNYFSARKESKMTAAEAQRRKERDDKFWNSNQEFKNLGEQLKALRAFAEVGLEDARIKRASGSSLIDDPELYEELNDKLFQPGNVSELWTRGFTIPIKTGSRLYLPTWDEKTRENGSLLGGMDYRWVEEGGTFDYSHPKYRALDMKLYKLMGLFPFSSELGDEPGFNKVMDITTTKGLNYMIEDALIRGTGSGRPQGLINSNCKIRVSKESGQNADTIVAENIFNMASRIIPECWTNGDLVFLGHPSTLSQVSTLTQSVGTGGSVNPLWHWRQGGERHNKLMGLDYIISDRCSFVGDEADIILVDLKSVIIVLLCG